GAVEQGPQAHVDSAAVGGKSVDHLTGNQADVLTENRAAAAGACVVDVEPVGRCAQARRPAEGHRRAAESGAGSRCGEHALTAAAGSLRVILRSTCAVE